MGMATGPDSQDVRPELIDKIVDSYAGEHRMQHIDSTFLPHRRRTIEVVETLRQIIFPGFFDENRVSSAGLRQHVGRLLQGAGQLLHEQIRQALRYEMNRHEGGLGDRGEKCDHRAAKHVTTFLDQLPMVRQRLTLDVRATFQGDPASVSTDENIFCYPGIDAIFVYRLAHELYRLNVPLLPRIMTEYAHNETGIDIHPGATIGESFCIDHGTGIVVGETCQIGDRVTLYQGVTLGALSLKGGHDRWHGRKRHPTIEDDVTIYGGAIILGGSTIIGRGATIGGSVFITSSIPAEHMVSMDKHNLKITPPKKRSMEFT